MKFLFNVYDFRTFLRLHHYIDLCIRYGECVLRHEEAQLCMDTNERLRKELDQEILMQRISSIMDKIINSLLKDISFRKSNKKVIYPTPKVNPRATSFTSEKNPWTNYLYPTKSTSWQGEMTTASTAPWNTTMDIGTIPQEIETTCTKTVGTVLTLTTTKLKETTHTPTAINW